MEAPREIVRLTVISNPGEADVICALLRAEGIPCSMAPQPLVLGEQMGGVSGFQEIFVRDVDLHRAQELLAGKTD
jgi:Putative prokaryotic signal transducing protein